MPLVALSHQPQIVKGQGLNVVLSIWALALLPIGRSPRWPHVMSKGEVGSCMFAPLKQNVSMQGPDFLLASELFLKVMSITLGKHLMNARMLISFGSISPMHRIS